MGDAKVESVIQQVTALLAAVFSWLFLTAIGVIVSGKLLAQRIPLRFDGSDHFTLNLIMFKLKAEKDEVSLGFLAFGAMIGLVTIFGGPNAYTFFKTQTGLEIGQWSSICAISSFLSIMLSALLWGAALLIRPSPLISQGDREQQIIRLKEISPSDEGED